MAPRPVHGLSLCSGIGGLDLALRLALGERYRSVGYVERDAYAAACIVARMEEAALDPAPVYDDLGTFDGRPWRGRVDLVSAGFPCQPFSTAGQQQGTDDVRWLWPSIARVLGECRPRYVFVENVPPLVDRGLDAVLCDLAALGFDAEWLCLRASDVGAPHRRDRFWLLAHHDSAGFGGVGGSGLSGDGHTEHRDDVDRRGEDVGAPFPASGPDERGDWQLDDQPAFRRGVDGSTDGLDESPYAFDSERVRCVGSAVVPACAAVAFLELADRTGVTL